MRKAEVYCHDIKAGIITEEVPGKNYTFRMKPDTYYIWCGGSCNYASKRRESGGAYIMEKEGMTSETYVISDIETTEFRMILKVMIHAMEVIPEGAEMAHEAMKRLIKISKQ